MGPSSHVMKCRNRCSKEITQKLSVFGPYIITTAQIKNLRRASLGDNVSNIQRQIQISILDRERDSSVKIDKSGES